MPSIRRARLRSPEGSTWCSHDSSGTAQEKAIRDHVLVNVDDDTKRLIRLANWDLYSGPVTEPDDGKPWPGFVKATRLIRDAISVGDLYLDSQSDEVTDTEPQWCDVARAALAFADHEGFGDSEQCAWDRELTERYVGRMRKHSEAMSDRDINITLSVKS